MLQKVIMTMINKEFDDMVCDRCGSDHISINMFFNVWKKVGTLTILITGVTSVTVVTMITVM